MAEKNFSRLTSDTIRALRFPLMVGIVFIHFGVMNGISIHGVVYGSNPPCWLVCMNRLFSEVVPRIGVPLFFLMSGYLFFWSGLDFESYKHKLKKRARTLLVPYIIWNAVAILYAVFSIPLHTSLQHIVSEKWTVWSFLGCFWDRRLGAFYHSSVPFSFFDAISAPQCVPMWYVRNLMVVVVFSPLLYFFVRNMGWWFVMFIGVVWAFVSPNENYMLMTLFFFSWGAYLAVKDEDFVASMRRFRSATLLYPVIALADMLTYKWDYNIYLHNVGIVVGIYAVVSAVATLLEGGKIKVNRFLTDFSFFLFALHKLFINDLAKDVICFFYYDSPVYMAMLYFVVPLITIAICLSLYWLLRKIAPRLAAVLTGGR